MALPERFSLIHSDFNGFLFAPVGHEESGAPLSVLSALTRLEIDPWAEGARLAKLPKEAAALALGAVIARLPAERRSVSDIHEIAARLVELLPRPRSIVLSAGADRPGAGRARRLVIWLFWVGLGVALATTVMPALSLWQ
jgi:hypothetical protein